MLCQVDLKPREMKYLIWRFYNNLMFDDIAKLDEQKSRQVIQNIVKVALDKMKKHKNWFEEFR